MARVEPRLRLTELLASLSLATDVGTGQPLGHGLRTCLLAVRLAQEIGCDPETVRSVHQVSLLRFLGCTADSAETARLAGGNDLAYGFEMSSVLNGGSVESMVQLGKTVGQGERPARKAKLVASAFLASGGPAQGLAAHCEVAARLAERLGLAERMVDSLRQAYERWDGKGYPSGIKGEAVSLEIRISSLARDVEIFQRRGRNLSETLMKRRGKAYDPALVDALLAVGEWRAEADWDEVLEAEPPPHRLVEDMDKALTAMADFADLKSPYTRGHSSRVAELAGTAGREAGFSTETVETLEHAGLVHDLGRVGVENGIWDKSRALSIADWEQVRLHPYLTQRILARCAVLGALGDLASSHHERLDRSGYHRQVGPDQLSIEARILAAADVMVALISDRPHREAFELDRVVAELREETESGRLDPHAAELVIAAAGGIGKTRRTSNPAGLSDREVEVLRLLSKGLTNRRMAEALFISAKTVGRHVENIYAKIGLSTRAGAALFAMENRLLDR